MPSAGMYFLAGAFAAFTQKNYIVAATNKGIHLYGLTILVKPKDYSFVPFSAIKNVTIKDGMFGQKKIEIEFKQGGKLNIKANKLAVGIKGQERNINIFEKMFQ
jgi:hypothetical protein